MAKKKGLPNSGNTAYIEAMREIRRSGATTPHRNKKKYHRPSAKKDIYA